MNRDESQSSGVEPSLPDKVWSAGQALKRFVFDGMRTVNRDQYRRRLEICETCDQRVENRCKKCGCSLALKAAGRAFHCPLKKWPGDQGTED